MTARRHRHGPWHRQWAAAAVALLLAGWAAVGLVVEVRAFRQRLAPPDRPPPDLNGHQDADD